MVDARRNPVSKDGRLQVIGDLGIDPEEGMLTALERLLAHHRSPELDDLPPLHGGLIGYLDYDVVREVEHLPNVPPMISVTPMR